MLKRINKILRSKAICETVSPFCRRVEFQAADLPQGIERGSMLVTAPAQVSDTFQFLMRETKEMFITLHLDGKNRVICMDVVSVGSLNQSIVHPRSVFMTACLSSAAAIICVHNLC